jgi:hypothetical protein
MTMRRTTTSGIDWVSGSQLVSGQPVHTYRKGRICVTPGCRTQLSRYNPTRCCSIHNELH